MMCRVEEERDLPARGDPEAAVVLDADALGERREVAREALLGHVVMQPDVRRLEHRPFERLVLHLVLPEALRLGDSGGGEQPRRQEGEERRATAMHVNSDPATAL